MANQIQNKLINFEAQPPAGVWEKIAASLDEEKSSSLARRLQQYEVIPQEHNWKNINVALDQDSKIRKGFFEKNRRLFIYSGAAAAIVVFVILINLLTPDRTISNEVAADKIKTSSESPSTVLHKEKNNSNSYTNKDKKSVPVALDKMDDGRYITLVKDDGNKVRLSKKILSVYNCATNEINVSCKEQMKNLQEKMASSLTSPSVDFAGFVELVRNLKEDQ